LRIAISGNTVAHKATPVRSLRWLNSRLFNPLPFKKSRVARLAWTQFHKRSPVNFRSLVGIPRERNAKAVALFALAALADSAVIQRQENEVEARELLDDLIGWA